MQIRHATESDLNAVNRVIEAAVMTWKLSERVRRLSMDSHLYHAPDLQHLDIRVAEEDGTVLGVAALDNDVQQLDDGYQVLLLHGLYVSPDHHHKGLGTTLFRTAEQQARERGLDGILVRAQKDAVDFFRHMGMERLPVRDPSKEYANRYWKLFESANERE